MNGAILFNGAPCFPNVLLGEGYPSQRAPGANFRARKPQLVVVKLPMDTQGCKFFSPATDGTYGSKYW